MSEGCSGQTSPHCDYSVHAREAEEVGSSALEPGHNEADDNHKSNQPFMCGVCEGFYGTPWTTKQRNELFKRMQKMKMNTYLYAPKDDYKHRIYWRHLYSPEEADDLRLLIEEGRKCGVTFVYAISPGRDITYSNKHDLDVLKKKLQQIKDCGCTSFALLFDDIDPDLNAQDEDCFCSAAYAQTHVTNEVYKFLGNPDVFLFCPTEYCASRAVPSLQRSMYLKTLGSKLTQGIDILWTGPKVVSRRITVDSIKEVAAAIQRHPVIWDNIHANDYDQARVYFGPYEGRSPELKQHLHGVLTNPNCEFEANYIAMHTLAQWSQNTVCHFLQDESADAEERTGQDMAMETDSDMAVESEYNPKLALVCAIDNWIPEFYKAKGSSSRPVISEMDLKRGSSHCSDDEICSKSRRCSSDDDEGDGNNVVERVAVKKRFEGAELLTTEDLLILCDLFYLPFEHGPRAVHLLKKVHWLINNVDHIKDANKMPRSEHTAEIRDWYARAINFHEYHKEIAQMVDKFVNIPNREILYELYNYVSDMRSVLSLVNSYIRWQGMGQPDKEPFRGGEQEPWIHTGGLHAELRRLLPMEGQNDIFPAPKRIISLTDKVFTIRPYLPEDKDEVYVVCRRTCDDGMDGSDVFASHPDLVADECIGGLLALFPQFCFLLEDEAGICGYAVSTPNVQEYQKKLVESWLPLMKKKYPNPDKAEKNTSAQSKNEQKCCLERCRLQSLMPMPRSFLLRLCGCKDNFCCIKSASYSHYGRTPSEVIKTFHGELRPVPESLSEKYPSFLHVNMMASRVDRKSPAPKQLLKCASVTLQAAGSRGLHTAIHASHSNMLAFYLGLGFEDITANKDVPENLLILGKFI